MTRFKTIEITRTKAVHVPEKATHHSGDLWEDPCFYYCSQIGVAGDHWWYWNSTVQEWKFLGHTKPSYIKELPE